VQLTAGTLDTLYGAARTGGLDLVLSHLGTGQLREFVTDRFGRWPQQVLTTGFCFVTPPEDPAGIGGLDDAVTAFARIAERQAPFVVNDLASVRFLIDTLWHAAGAPDRQGWYLDLGVSAAMAVQAAAQRGGYTIWGLHPFLMFQQQQQSPMRPVLYRDPLLQRVIASVVVHPGRVRGVNIAGALALERFLTRPSTQARIRNFRLPNLAHPVFWSAAQHNDHGAEPG
jgi:tungstate transport system substrate-binding protein